MSRYKSDRADKVQWLLKHRELWGNVPECTTQILRSGLYSKGTYTGDVQRGLWRLIELAGEVDRKERTLASLRQKR